jgi:hypothetical protein
MRTLEMFESDESIRIKDGIEYRPLTPLEISALREGDELLILDSLAVVLPAVYITFAETGFHHVWINGRKSAALNRHLYTRALPPNRDEIHELTGYDL